MHNQRIERLQDKLRTEGLDGFVGTHPVDNFYFTGTMQSGFLVVPADGEAVFFVRRSVTRAKEEGAVRVEPLGSLKTWKDRVGAAMPRLGSGCKLAAAFDTLVVDGFERLRAALPEAEWANGSALVRAVRMTKDEQELDCMRRAARNVDEALREALPKLKAGMREIELLAEIEYALRRRGHLGLMRVRAAGAELVTGIAASGAAVAKPSAFDGPAGGEGLHPAFSKGAGWSTIEAGEPILLDIGCNVDGYVTDQTRTAVIGELPADLAAAYDASEAILREIESMLKPGAVCEELYERSVAMAAEFGLAEHYMGFGQDAVKFVGHGIGLEIDEWPVLARGFRTELAPGMVLAIEPKFTFPGRGVVGIENSYAITEDGFEKLTISPEGLWRIEP
ncbi:Xaa-Pro peptidase family protein [Paenibacillus sp.]|uniref:M24 family metallopeptidase n=1 Tax=Paenibacillus sp. TaxID=58172 RepID=UPI002D35A56C|nr:Xaa-Pro peptidase family protein [Paenibacillus sp.]HZG85320.1 Xaa-Pro peptidase family protein [Paenibacillus sp.]